MKQLTDSLATTTVTAATGLILMWNLAMPNFAHAQGEGHAMTPPPSSGKALNTDMVWQSIPIASNVPDLMTSEAASQASTNQIVLHYGLGIRVISAEIKAESLTRDGYPAVAIPGGPRGEIEVFVARKVLGTYSAVDLNTGLLGMHAKQFYDKYIKNSSPDPVGEFQISTQLVLAYPRQLGALFNLTQFQGLGFIPALTKLPINPAIVQSAFLI